MSRSHRGARRKKRKQSFLTPQTLLIGGFFLLLFGIIMWQGLRPSSDVASQNTQIAIGQPAPQFQAPDLEGHNTSLADYEGDVIVLNFWATWCPPCRAEMPGIQSVYDMYQGEGLTVLAVNARENVPVVAAFQEQFGVTFPILVDEQGQVMNLYQAHSLPTTIIVDRDGVVQHIQNGSITAAQLEAIIVSLL